MAWVLKNNADLRSFMVHLRAAAISQGQHSVVEALNYVLDTTWTTSSEFLGESKLALERIRGSVQSNLAREEYETLLMAVSAIEAALRPKS